MKLALTLVAIVAAIILGIYIADTRHQASSIALEHATRDAAEAVERNNAAKASEAGHQAEILSEALREENATIDGEVSADYLARRNAIRGTVK